MGPTLYYIPTSPPCRAVFLVAKALNVELKLKLINLRTREHHMPEFKKLNPVSTVPTLVDEGVSIGESHAIIMYLANQYGRGSPLYPEDPKARALVDWRLIFDAESLYARFSDYYFPIAFEGQPADPARLALLEETLQTLNTFLEGQDYAAGDQLTLADLSLVATIASFEPSDIDFKKYANIKRWYETVQQTAPRYEEIEGKGLEAWKGLVANYLKKFPVAFGGQPAEPAKLVLLEETLQTLNTLLEGQSYAAGDQLTLTDLGLAATICAFEATDFDFKKYVNIKRWYDTVQQTAPRFEEICGKGLEAWRALIASYSKK